jgi:hypothetical protein
MQISKKFKGGNFEGFFRAHFSDFYTTSTNRCILPISYSSVIFFLYISTHDKDIFKLLLSLDQNFFNSSLSKVVYFQEKLKFLTFSILRFSILFVNLKKLPL